MADFSPQFITLVGLISIELPETTIRLCDGGFVYWGADKFASEDPDFGAVESVEAFSEAAGDEAPGGRMTFLPRSTAAAAALSQSDYQGSPIRFWLGRVDEETGALLGEPELVADMELDTTRLRLGPNSRGLDIEFISIAERLFMVNEGNVLSTRFHQSVWPGELGLDNTTGVGKTIAWGVAGPARGISGGGFARGIGGMMDHL